MKFCKDCKQYRFKVMSIDPVRSVYHMCSNDAFCRLNQVTGAVEHIKCDLARYPNGHCGEEGEHFEQKEEAPEIKMVPHEPKRWWRFWS